ncbi:MAG: hypothetical protein IH974_08930 [Myxococcales bacterium]|nr:hypothetical protein [Myxococcales bacterium]
MGSALLLGIVAVTVELGSAASCFFLKSRAPFLLYTPPTVSRAAWENYVKVRDPVVGWPTTDALNSDGYDASGSRPIPAFANPGKECMTLYGDSFTYASEVAHEAAWGNLLAESLGCRVGNFGVGGYGTDQALLRFESNESDVARVSILGIIPHNVLRNINQYRYLLDMRSVLGFKPRFVLAGNDLRLVPLPKPTFEELALLASNPGQLLPHEAFLPGTRLGPVPLKFPYTSSCSSSHCFIARSEIGCVTNRAGEISWRGIILPRHDR